MYEEHGYEMCKLLSTGKWAGLRQQFFTTGLFVGLDDVGYEYRYCYEHYGEAAVALFNWDGVGDPPGEWLVKKGAPGGDVRRYSESTETNPMQ